MKIRFLSLVCAVLGLSSLAVEKSVAGVSFSVGIFDAPLGQCGHWIDRPGYGRCWYPAYVSSDWRPYCEGYWMWTDAGWYWVSNEQWAWATYHYGRWVQDPYYGWVWTPDTEWGPSWVSWRQGDEYVGWAPLPPGASFGPDGYVVVHEQPARAFVFVEIGHFSEPIHRNAVIVNNVTIINKTVNITKISRVNNVVVNNGPRVQELQKVNSRSFTEPPPRVAVDHSRSVQPRETSPSFSKQPNEEKAPAREPENVERNSNAPRQPSEPPGERENKPTEKPPAESQPRVAQPKQPPQEKHEDSHKEQGKEEKEKEKKNEQGGN